MKKFLLLMVIAFYLVNSFSYSQELKVFSFRDGMSWYLKSNKEIIDDKFIDLYAEDFYNDIYKKYRSDEFEWNEKKGKIKKDIEDGMSNVGTDYIIYFVAELLEYNFDKEAFNIKFSEGVLFSYESSPSSYSKLNELELLVQNLYEYKFVPISKDKANAFIKSRKDSSGGVDRKVTIKAKIKLLDYKSQEYVKYFEKFDGKKYARSESRKYPYRYNVMAIVLEADVVDRKKGNVLIGNLVKDL